MGFWKWWIGKWSWVKDPLIEFMFGVTSAGWCLAFLIDLSVGYSPIWLLLLIPLFGFITVAAHSYWRAFKGGKS